LVKISPRLLKRPDEDCLYLNIWAPTEHDGTFGERKRPVLVFFHGGGYIGGSGFTELNCAFYDGQGLANNMDAVVVTVNYRPSVAQPIDNW
jgi:para-nitrobenzyl esterase